MLDLNSYSRKIPAGSFHCVISTRGIAWHPRILYLIVKPFRLQDIVGRARGFVPYVGWLTICMNDFPKLKYFVLGTLGLFVVLRRE